MWSKAKSTILNLNIEEYENESVNNITVQNTTSKFVDLFLCVLQGNAQELLTLKDAVQIALQNNYEIKIAQNDLKIDESNVAPGNAGMLPSATVNCQNNNIQIFTNTC
jgi:outer membrane protein TolC